MKTVLYYILFAFWFLLSLLPLRVLYLLSDLLYFLLYYCVKYRKKLVRKNLTDSFPDKSLKEITTLEKKFFHFLCDYIVETIKLLSISEKNMRKRMRFEGLGELSKSIEEGRSCSIYLGHYCNWEWITSFPLHVGKGVISGQIYHVLENEIFDRLFLYLRGRFGAESIPMAETLRRIATYRHEKKQMVIGFISDQVPFWNNIHYWTNFLNHDTPVLTGAERITRQANFAAYYTSVSRPRRGYYICEFKKLSDNPKELSEFELTEKYFRELEKDIMIAPQYWLWTHNRWKRTREEYIERYDVENKIVRLG